MLPYQHDHGLDLTPLVGTDWIRLTVLVGMLVATAAVLVDPLVPLVGTARRVPAAAAGVVAAGVLILNADLLVPAQAAALSIFLIMAAFAAAPDRATVAIRGTAPLLVAASLVAVLVTLACAPTGPSLSPLPTATVLGTVGLAWHGHWVPRSRAARATAQAAGGSLAIAVLGCVALTAVD